MNFVEKIYAWLSAKYRSLVKASPMLSAEDAISYTHYNKFLNHDQMMEKLITDIQKDIKFASRIGKYYTPFDLPSWVKDTDYSTLYRTLTDLKYNVYQHPSLSMILISWKKE